MWYHPKDFEKQRPMLEMRMAVIKAIRRFFDEQDFYEVQTPVLQTCPTVDTHIHGFKTELLSHTLGHERDIYLQTSPEFAMKKLMVAGVEKLYQICPVFRNGEGSKLHSPEFTMIEWYRANAGYEDIMDDCVGLLRSIAKSAGIAAYSYKGARVDPFGEWQKISVAKAFEQYAGIDLCALLSSMPPHPNPPPQKGGGDKQGKPSPLEGGGMEGGVRLFAQQAEAAGVRVTDMDGWDDIFFAVMAEKIEPHLGMSTPCILYDYPASMACLSRRKQDDPRFAERFELYMAGVELANAFGELTDPAEQRARFEADLAEKERLYGVRYPIDEEFLAALECGMPESGGIALGIDRLVMLTTGADDIRQVLWVDSFRASGA